MVVVVFFFPGGLTHERGRDAMKNRVVLSLIVFAATLQAVAQVPASDLNRKAKVQADMTTYNPQYKRLHAERAPILAALSDQVFAREARGEKAACSHEILIETHWLMEYTADFARVDRRLQDLRNSLAHPEQEKLAEEQDPADGSWGRCYTEWMERLDASFDYLAMYQEHGLKAKYPYTYLDRVNSPER